MMGLIKVTTCPYCPRTGEGVIAIDADVALKASPPAGAHVEVEVSDGDPAGIVVFDPDGTRNRPCPHVVSLLLDVEVRKPMVIEDDDRRISYTGNFDHARFASDPMAHELSEFLWLEVNGGDEPAIYPTTPFRIRYPRRPRAKVRGTTWEIWIGGTVFMAMEPEVFLDQLREGFLRGQTLNRDAS
jgi:hypothetical protein